MFTNNDINRGYERMQDEWQRIRDYNSVDANNIEYWAQQLINAYVAGLVDQGTQPAYNSCYYRLDGTINNLPATIRVANHRGYCDASYKRSAHANTGVALYDKALQSEPPRYVVSIEVLRDREKRGGIMRVSADTEDNITHIELININYESKLDECLSFIDSELNDLF